MVLPLSDGDDNAGGISADAISALRYALATFQFTPWLGRERLAHDVELEDVGSCSARLG